MFSCLVESFNQYSILSLFYLKLGIFINPHKPLFLFSVYRFLDTCVEDIPDHVTKSILKKLKNTFKRIQLRMKVKGKSLYICLYLSLIIGKRNTLLCIKQCRLLSIIFRICFMFTMTSFQLFLQCDRSFFSFF